VTALEEKQRNATRRPDANFSSPVIASGETFVHVKDQISGIHLLRREIPKLWYRTFGLGMLLVFVFMCSATYVIGKGIGILGNEIPNAWGYPITNFVWWIGIGHAGTLISAFLLLLNQSWRSSINRFAEAMTIFAVVCAGMFPLLHLGRPWLFYWILP
jgi:Ni/Fe-hydrogenase subunit HybB-like protein